MPFPELVPWNRKEIYRDRRPVNLESVGSSPVASRWRDSPSFSFRGNHHGGQRAFSRRGSADHRRPPGRGRQQGNWHMFPEESSYGYMPSRSCERMMEDRSYWASPSHADGRYRNGKDYSKVKGYQKDSEGPVWQQNNPSSTIAADRPFNGSPVFYGGKPCNGLPDTPVERRHNGMFPDYGIERHFNAPPVASFGRQGNGYFGGFNEKTRNGFSPRNIVDRPFNVSPAVSWDKPCQRFSNSPSENSRNGFYGASVVKANNRYAPSVAVERPISSSTSVSGDRTSNGFSCTPVVKAANGSSPHFSADRSNIMSPVISRSSPVPFHSAVAKKHDEFPDAPTEKTGDGFSSSVSVEKYEKLSPSSSIDKQNLLICDVPVDKAHNGFSSSFADGERPCHMLSSNSIKSVCNELSLGNGAENTCNASLLVSTDKLCSGGFGASSGSICNGIAGPAVIDLPQVNSEKLSNDKNASDCQNEQPENLVKYQHGVEIGEVDKPCIVTKHEKENILGVDWRPLIWTRSGSLSSWGHTDSSRSVPVDSKSSIDASQRIKGTARCSPAVDAADCITSSITSEETSTSKKARLGWGHGLAKYEKKIVDDPCGCGILNDIHSSRVGGECISPATHTSTTCCSLLDNEQKSCKEGNASGSFSVGHPDNTKFIFEDMDRCFIAHEVRCLLDTIHSDDQCPTVSSSASNNVMSKLLSWKMGILKAVVITDSEIESLEGEIYSLKSECSGNFHCSALSSSLAVNGGTQRDTACNGSAMPASLQVNSFEVRDDIESPGTATSNPVLPSRKVESTLEIENSCQFSQDLSTNSSHMVPGFTLKEEKGGRNLSFDDCNSKQGSDDPACHSHDIMDIEEESNIGNFIIAANKEEAAKVSDELSQLVSKSGTTAVDNCHESPNDLLIRDEIAKRKKLLRFAEIAITMKYRALQQLWKEDARLLEIRKNRPKSSKRLERSPHYARLKSNSPTRSQISSSEGSTRLVPYSQTVALMTNLLSECPIKMFKDELQMPSLILDENEKRMSKFISYNGLVEDPVLVEEERGLINPWTPDEKETFLDKLALFGKDFRKIASYLDHKTTADCVEFYYKNHKSALFDSTRKKKSVRSGLQSKPVANDAYLLTSGQRWNQEREAADVLAGISGSISSEATSSCVSNSFNHGDVHRHWKRKKVGGKRKRTWPMEDMEDINETCSGESCGEMNFSSLDWTDEEKHMLLQAVQLHGNNFELVSKYVKTRYSAECKAFYSKIKKRFGSTRSASAFNATRHDGQQDINVRLATPLLEPVL